MTPACTSPTSWGCTVTDTGPMTTNELDTIHAAWLAGYDQGRAERVEAEIQDQVQARLHRLSLQPSRMARRLAATKGPAWAAMIDDAGEGR